jgi:hypothetical protein
MPLFKNEDVEELRTRLEIILQSNVQILEQINALLDLTKGAPQSAMTERDQLLFATYIEGLTKGTELVLQAGMLVEGLTKLSRELSDDETFMVAHRIFGTRGQNAQEEVARALIKQYSTDTLRIYTPRSEAELVKTDQTQLVENIATLFATKKQPKGDKNVN